MILFGTCFSDSMKDLFLCAVAGVSTDIRVSSDLFV